MAARAASRPFVARVEELRALRDAVARAAAGEAATVLVSGEAGVGKTRLVAESARIARDEGSLVLRGRCVDVGDGELAYAPIAGALRSLAAQLGEDDLAAALGPRPEELVRLVPELAPPGAGPPSERSHSGRARLFDLLLGALRRLGADRPVVLVVEDLHWADGATRDLLRFIVRAADAERVALIITHRSDGLTRAHQLRTYLVELRRDDRVTSVDLAPFSRAELADHVAAICGAPQPPARVDRLHERTEGNPFFVEELLAAGSEALPASLRDVMAVQLDRLPATAERVVDALAVAGRSVDHRLLERAAGVPPHEFTAALRAALDAGVIVPGADRSIEFRHALLREATYARLLPGERETLHAAVAQELEADPELTGAACVGELAHHWHHAGEPERALAASVRAGCEAERGYAHGDALRHFQRSLELWDRAAPDTRTELDRVELGERAAEAASAAGEAGLAIALATRTAELAEPERAGEQHARLARLLWDAGRGPEALRASATAIARTPHDRTPERARMLESHARLLLLTGRDREARAPIDEAIAIAREVHDHEVEAAGLATRVIALGDDGDAAIAAGHEALRAARRHGDPETLMRAYINAAEALDHGGRVRDAIGLAREGIDEARRLGMERVMGVHLQGELAGRLVKLGHHDDAERAIEQGLRAAPEGTSAVTLHDAAATLAAQRGDGSAVHAAVASARANAEEAGSGQAIARSAAALAEAALGDGDDARALAIVQDALELVRDGEYVWYSGSLYALGARALADSALRARAAGADDEARAAQDAADALLARLDAQVIEGGVPETDAVRAQVAAELTRLRDAPDPAAWEAARRRWDELGFPFPAAECAWREAEARLLAGEDRARAAGLLGDALDHAEALGARPLAKAVQALARRARIAVGADDAPAADEPPAGLSARELEVLRLMAAGDTNRAIGDQLFITEKTVGSHVSHILSKLGVANRAEAATAAHRLGVSPPRR